MHNRITLIFLLQGVQVKAVINKCENMINWESVVFFLKIQKSIDLCMKLVQHLEYSNSQWLCQMLHIIIGWEESIKYRIGWEESIKYI